MKPILPACLLVLVLAAAPAAADLPEPDVNEGATRVTVDGSRVVSEAWAKALGHAVDAVVVVRVVQQPEGPPKLETYERWTLDGKTKAQRGDKALGKAWEKLLWDVLEESSEGAAGGRKRRELMEKVDRHLPAQGRHTVGTWVVSWSVGEALSEGSQGRSVARIATFTITPAEGTPATPREREPGAPTTPRERTEDAGKDAPEGDRDEEDAGTGQERPVTPSPGARRLPPRVPRDLRVPSSGRSSGSTSTRAEASADSRTGARKHARVELDLSRWFAPRPPEAPKAPEKPTTPREKR